VSLSRNQPRKQLEDEFIGHQTLEEEEEEET